MCHSPSFSTALTLILKYEGGFVNDPSDKGGATNKGITTATYNSYRKSKNLPLQSVALITDSEVADIYSAQFWAPLKCDSISLVSQGLAICVFDTSVNSGIGEAALFLQRAIGATADGVIGPGSLKALQTNFNDATISNYLQQRKDFYKALTVKDPTQLKFLAGWNNRVDNLKTFIASLPKKTPLVNLGGATK